MLSHFKMIALFRTTVLAIFAITLPLFAQEDFEEKPQVEFKINGEAFTKEQMIRGLAEANTCANGVCPTDPSSGWQMRRARLIQLVPERQFLTKNKIDISDKELKKRIEEIKAHPNPFGKSPPKPLAHVMVRDCMPWYDVRLIVKTNLGFIKYAEQEFRKKWPTDEDWMDHANSERNDFETTHGKFRRISFSFAQWPKGAKTETEALVLLKKLCVAANDRIAAGESFDKVAVSLRKGAKTIDQSAPAFLAPFAFMGPAHKESIAALEIGASSEPLNSPFSWEILKRVPLTDQDIADSLHRKFINDTIGETRQRVAKETKVVKVDWMTEDQLHSINLE